MISEEYKAYLRSPKWKRKRKRVLKRANYICEKCHKEKAWQVHHLTYAHIFHERLKELIALCERCHLKEHDLLIKEIKEKIEMTNKMMYDFIYGGENAS